MVTLRPYQQEAVDALLNWDPINGNPLLVVPTGGGKSVIQAAYITRNKDRRVLCVTHVKELVAQNHAAFLRLCPDADAGIYSAGIGRRDTTSRVLFAGLQSVFKRPESFGRFDVAIVDECFVGSTKIATPSGQIRIDKVHPGDTVLCATGVGVVQAVSARTVNALVRLEFADGSSIECTADHPFFTTRGWVNAGLMEGEVAIDIEALRLLWEPVQTESLDISPRHGKGHQGKGLAQAAMLRLLLCQEACQPDEQAAGTQQGSGEPQEEQASTDQAWRERSIAAAATACFAACSRGRMGGRGISSDKGRSPKWLSYELQDRHREQEQDDRDRGGRRIALHARSKRAGRKKNEVPSFLRVDRVSVVERASNVPVFNLQVSRHPSYFADGRLVHNCHRVPQRGVGMYRQLFAALKATNPDVRIIGMTATPFRTDSGSLSEGDDRLFHGTAYECKLTELIEQGYLSNIHCRGTAASIDTKGVHTRQGEFVAEELEQRAMADGLVKRAVAELVQRAGDRRSWLLFCCGVGHAEAVAAELREAHGISCDTVFGHTPNDRRDEVILAYKRGDTRAISNCKVLTTGFDAPQTDVIALMLATLSPVLYVQMIGRGLRTAPGKPDCLLLDYGGNVLRHGPINDVRLGKQSGDGTGKAPLRECHECHEFSPLSALVCWACGHPFPRSGTKPHDETPDEDIVIIRGLDGEPSGIEKWKVTRYDAIYHPAKAGKRPTMRVIYHGKHGRRASKFLCFEHEEGSFPRRAAERWWRRMVGNDSAVVPNRVGDAVRLLRTGIAVKEPSSITVDISGQWPEIKRLDVRDIEHRLADVEVPR